MNLSLRAAIRGIFDGTHNPADDGFVKKLFAAEQPTDVMRVACEVAKVVFPKRTGDVEISQGFLMTDKNRHTGMKEWFGVPPDKPGVYAAMNNCGYYEEFDCPLDGLRKAAAFHGL